MAFASMRTTLIFQRSLFWRSGHYSALLQSSSLFKIQVSLMRPDKVWLYNLEVRFVDIFDVFGCVTFCAPSDLNDVTLSSFPR